MPIMSLRTLNISDSSEMNKIQVNCADPRMFTFRGVESIKRAIMNDRCIGYFEDNKLVAYSIFSIASKTDIDSLPNKYSKYLLIGRFAGSVVACSHKGQGIQKILLENHVEFAKESGFELIMAYTHPDNKGSQKNIINVGLHPLGLRYIEDKKDYRLIFASKIT